MSLTESTPLAGAALTSHTATDWTVERITELRRMWDEGLTGSRIAAELGGFAHCGDGGRSAVIGKAHRLGLRTRAKAAAPVTRHVVKHLHKRSAEAAQGPAVEVLPEPDPVIFSATPCSLEELTQDTCRFPIGDPGTSEFRFCGGMARSGAPYCAGHMRIAYSRPAPARPRTERTETGWG